VSALKAFGQGMTLVVPAYKIGKVAFGLGKRVYKLAQKWHRNGVARRAARRAGHSLKLDPASIQQSAEEAIDLEREIEDVVRSAKK
jgi:hypothetical protein